MRKKRLTQHEKNLEIAKASAPRYGIYFNAADQAAVKDFVDLFGGLIIKIIESSSNEDTKQKAIDLIGKSVPKIENVSFSDCNIWVP